MVQSQSEDDGDGDNDGDERRHKAATVMAAAMSSSSTRRLSFFYFFWNILLIFMIFFPTYGGADYRTEPDLIVHLVPHSHVDAGWLETSDTYFENAVADILTNVLNQLDHDVTRRFVWVS